MGLLKSLASKAIPAVASSIGAYFGGPSGAGTGYEIGNMVSGAVGLGNDGVSSSDKSYMKYYQRLARENADYSFNQNLQMWNLNNAYNDPSAQMERLKNAGLNPNLVYGGGNVTGNTSGSTPTYTTPDASMVDKRTQRAQLGLALQEHQQRITNQAIENELARERIGLATREADREDRLADAQIEAYAANLGLTRARIGDIQFEHDTYTPPDRRSLSEKSYQGAKNIGEDIGSKIVKSKTAADAFRGLRKEYDYRTGKYRWRY